MLFDHENNEEFRLPDTPDAVKVKFSSIRHTKLLLTAAMTGLPCVWSHNHAAADQGQQLDCAHPHVRWFRYQGEQGLLRPRESLFSVFGRTMSGLTIKTTSTGLSISTTTLRPVFKSPPTALTPNGRASRKTTCRKLAPWASSFLFLTVATSLETVSRKVLPGKCA